MGGDSLTKSVSTSQPELSVVSHVLLAVLLCSRETGKWCCPNTLWLVRLLLLTPTLEVTAEPMDPSILEYAVFGARYRACLLLLDSHSYLNKSVLYATNRGSGSNAWAD